MSRKKLIDYINRWLTRFKRMETVAVELAKLKDQIEWEEDTINKVPASLINSTYAEKNNNYYTAILDQLEEKFPIFPETDPTFLPSNLQIASSTGSAIFMTQPEGNVTFEFEDGYGIIENQLNKKEELDDINNKIEILKNEFRKFDIDLNNEFQESVKQYYLKHEEKENYIIGISMRNLIEHLHGKLWIKAKKPNEQKFSLKLVLRRLKKTIIELNDTQINKIKENYDDLHQKLSKLAKNQNIHNLNIRILFVEYINYVYTLLYFIEING